MVYYMGPHDDTLYTRRYESANKQIQQFHARIACMHKHKHICSALELLWRNQIHLLHYMEIQHFNSSQFCNKFPNWILYVQSIRDVPIGYSEWNVTYKKSDLRECNGVDVWWESSGISWKIGYQRNSRKILFIPLKFRENWYFPFPFFRFVSYRFFQCLKLLKCSDWKHLLNPRRSYTHLQIVPFQCFHVQQCSAKSDGEWDGKRLRWKEQQRINKHWIFTSPHFSKWHSECLLRVIYFLWLLPLSLSGFKSHVSIRCFVLSSARM